MIRRILQFDLVAWWSNTPLCWTRFVLVLGVVFRLAQYFANRTFWMDESFLSGNLRRGPVFGVFGRLYATQLVPPGFLVIERIAQRVCGESTYALRFFPLVCGIASLFLFAAVASKCLAPRVVPIALALFAGSDELIYLSSELKPYSSDVAAALVCWLAALHAQERGLTPRRLGALAIIGSVVVWFSQTSAFVLGGIGIGWIAAAARAQRWPDVLRIVMMCTIWALSFWLCFVASSSQLAGDRAMWAFWSFAFPPLDGTILFWVVSRLLYLFVNPLDYYGLIDARILIAPPVVCGVVGAAALCRSRPLVFAWLFVPAMLALAAAALRLYPFHGRLIVFLVPALDLTIAAGFESLWTKARRVWMIVAMGTALLAGPWIRDIYHLAEPRNRVVFNPHGDRRPAWLVPNLFSF